MSWNDYVTKQLIGTGNVSRGAIAGLDGSIWAISEGWNLSPTECQSFVTGFSNTATLVQSGMMCAGEKYFFLSGTDEVLRGKCKSKGIHIAKTKSAIIVGQYDDPIQPGQCASTVEALADYLKNCNY